MGQPHSLVKAKTLTSLLSPTPTTRPPLRTAHSCSSNSTPRGADIANALHQTGTKLPPLLRRREAKPRLPNVTVPSRRPHAALTKYVDTLLLSSLPMANS